MKISTGESESHPSVMPLDPRPAPDPVTPRSPGADSPANAASQIGGTRDCTGERVEQMAAAEADVAAAQASGMADELGRRQHYQDILAQGSYGDEIPVPKINPPFNMYFPESNP
jgi:hypothetical protein